jgi:hypothetical protein
MAMRKQKLDANHVQLRQVIVLVENLLMVCLGKLKKINI